MSLGYNDRLKKGIWKGLCGDAELTETSRSLERKISQLHELVMESDYTVAFTGAGISTAAGIPDFRGPTGVWTAEQKRAKPPTGVDFDRAVPSLTHMALKSLLDSGHLRHIVSQNVDGLHLRSGVPREHLSELHGNIFAEVCDRCGKEYVRDFDLKGMGLKLTGRFCEIDTCKGPLRDKTVDWDTPLPEAEMETADAHLKKAKLCLCLGTSLRIRPAGNMPMKTVRMNGKSEEGKLVIVNLQETHLDKKATVCIHAKVDEVMRRLAEKLKLDIPPAPALPAGGSNGKSATSVDDSVSSDNVTQASLEPAVAAHPPGGTKRGRKRKKEVSD